MGDGDEQSDGAPEDGMPPYDEETQKLIESKDASTNKPMSFSAWTTGM